MNQEINDLIKSLQKTIIYLESLKTVEILSEQSLSEPDPLLEKLTDEQQVLFSLLKSNDWPQAVPPSLICDSDEDKSLRGDLLLGYINEDLFDKSVLDFGCGEGHFIENLSSSPNVKNAIGYDIIPTGSLTWEKDGKGLLTTDLSKVEINGPYDIILLYDVLDHCLDPVAVLKQVSTLCKASTLVFVRCHSWMARHGGHQYKQLNKAWVHLFFTEEELALLNVKLEFVQKYYFPLDTQKKWIEDANLKIIKSEINTENIEPFIKNTPELISRLPMVFKTFPEWQMSQSFNDYILGKKVS